MATTVLPSKNNSQQQFFTPASGGLQKYLEKNGRMPPVTLKIKPLDQSNPEFTFSDFISYEFQQSILTPVDIFSFSMLLDPDKINKVPVNEGDVVELFGNNITLCVGKVDTIEQEIDADSGYKITIIGRNLMGQLEDQDAVSSDSKWIAAQKMTIAQVISFLSKDTKISPKPILRDAPPSQYNFATSPGETKLASLSRFVESLNVLVWMSQGNQIIVGKPSVNSLPKQALFIMRSNRTSNVLSMKVSRSSAMIPNIIVPIFNGQEFVQDRVKATQAFYNPAEGPDRLRRLNHLLPKAVVVSAPQGTSPEDLLEVTFINAAISSGPKAGYGTILEAYGRREIARRNKDQLIVQIQMMGHYNDLGEPFLIDTVYSIVMDPGGVSENMYLYQVEYQLTDSGGQMTNLWFCKLRHTLVSDLRVK